MGSTTNSKPRVSTFLMFQDGRAEEAMNYYVSLFGSEAAKITSIVKYGASNPQGAKEGSVQVASMVIHEQQLMFSDSFVKHNFEFTPSISLFVNCKSIEEIELLYNGLSKEGFLFMPLDNYGFSEKFAWVKDKFGVTWQLSL
eukprot:gene1105-1405_t